jgi:hypothetical protein
MTPPESQSFQDVLVHYTSAQGLEGILRSNTLWATHSSYTNDEEELQTWKKMLDRFYETRFWETPQFKNLNFSIEFTEKGKGEENGWRTALECIKEMLIKADEHGEENGWRTALECIKEALITTDEQQEAKTYIFSFSQNKKTEKHIQNNGRLSQWRAYGDYGIVFNKIEFKNLVYTIPSFLLDPVSYVNVDEPLEKGGKIYQRFRGLLITTALTLNEEIDTQSLKTALQTLFPEDYKNDEAHPLVYYAKISPFIKNIGFEEENEYRLSIFNSKSSSKQHTERLTIRRHRIIPYVDVFEHAPLHHPLPIEKILIGPAPAGEQAERKKMVETLLRHLKKDIPVHCSAIPYRG